MYSAIYYPHTTIRDESLFKAGLLLWDKLEYISPFKEVTPDYKNNRHMQMASELIVKPYIPSDEEKKLAHDQIEELLNADLPDSFVFIPENPRLGYEIYPDKFMPKTWEILENSAFVKRSLLKDTKYNVYDFTMSSSLGLTLMSILADCCAGLQKRTITDEVDSYAALTRYLTQLNSGEYVKKENTGMPSSVSLKDFHERLLTVSFKTINIKEIDIAKLIELRVRAEKSNDTLLKELRHKYFEKLDKCITQLSKEARHKGDQEEITRTFQSE